MILNEELLAVQRGEQGEAMRKVLSHEEGAQHTCHVR